MNWEAVGAIAEAIGVIAILVSLVYLAVQIRQSTEQFTRGVEATELAAFERNIESGNHLREILILHPELAELMMKGFKGYEGMDRAEKFRFGLLLRNMFSGMQGAYIRQLSVKHDPIEFEGTARVIDELLTYRGTREWLDTTTPDWRPEFRKLVDERLVLIKEQLDA